MKALIENTVSNPGDSRVEVAVRFFDESNGLFDGVNLFGIDIPTTSFSDLAGLNNRIESSIVAEAASRSYAGFGKNDIIWHLNNQIHKAVAGTLVGVVSDTIDGKVVGNTTLFANSSGKNLMVTGVWINPTEVAGLGTPPTINIGKTANAYSDVVNALSLSLAVTADTYSQADTKNNAVFVADNESLVCRVASASVLTTTYNFKVIITGIFV